MPIKQWNNLTPDFSGSNRTNTNATAGLSQVSTIFSDLAKSIGESKQRAFENSLAEERMKIAREEFDLNKRVQDNANTLFEQTQSDRNDEINSYNAINEAYKNSINSDGKVDYTKFNDYMNTAREKITNSKVFNNAINTYFNDASKAKESQIALDQYALSSNMKTIIQDFKKTKPDPKAKDYYSKFTTTLTELGFTPDNVTKALQAFTVGLDADQKALIDKLAIAQAKANIAHTNAATADTMANLKSKQRLAKEAQITSDIMKKLAPQLSTISDVTTRNRLITNELIKAGVSVDNLPEYNKQMGVIEFNALAANHNKKIAAGTKLTEQQEKKNKTFENKLDNLYKESGISGNWMSSVDNKVNAKRN